MFSVHIFKFIKWNEITLLNGYIDNIQAYYEIYITEFMAIHVNIIIHSKETTGTHKEENKI